MRVAKRLFLAMFMASLFIMVTGIKADAAFIDPVGDPVITGSWSQRWGISGGSFDAIEVFVISGSTDLENNGMGNFSLSGWSANLINPDYALATGPSTGSIQLDIFYTADVSVPFQMDLLTYSGGSFLGGVSADWDGRIWTLAGNVSPEGHDRRAVPEPSTLLLLGSGMVGLAMTGIRKFRRNA